MSAVTHLPLNARKVVASRLLALTSLRRQQPQFEREDAVQTLAGIEDLYLRQTATGLRSQNSVPLDRYVLDTFRIVSQQVQVDTTTQDHAALVDSVLQTIDAQASSLSCSSCSYLAPTVCNGEYSDDQIVERSGICILPITNMFRTALSSTVGCYQNFSSIFGSATCPSVDFSTAAVQKRPHDIPVPYYVGGVTNYHDSAGPNSQVCLCLCIDEFEWETYLAMMYVLFHECVCHVFQGTVPWRGQTRQSTNANDAFAEGWMDWIAQWLLIGEADRHAAGIEFPALQRDTGRRFYLARIDSGARRPSKYAVARIIGTRAAEKLLSLLGALPESKSDHLSHFLRLSLDLNLSSVDPKGREAFAWKVDQYLPERLPSQATDAQVASSIAWDENPSAVARFADLVRNYLQTNDFAAFVHEVALLPPPESRGYTIHLTNDL